MAADEPGAGTSEPEVQANGVTESDMPAVAREMTRSAEKPEASSSSKPPLPDAEPPAVKKEEQEPEDRVSAEELAKHPILQQ